MERRTVFHRRDLTYLANLCHDCKACYYVCPYTPPHQMSINIPRILSEIRLWSYGQYSSPRILGRAFKKNGVFVMMVALASIAVAAAAALLIGDPFRLFVPHPEQGSFYEILPYALLVSAGLILGGAVVFAYALGLRRFMSETTDWPKGTKSLKVLLMAAKDAFLHSGLRGGGAGCYHEEKRASPRFLVLHALVIYGFVLALASTASAAAYQDVLGIMPPYGLTSIPVVLGVSGGLCMVAASVALMVLNRGREKAPVHDRMAGLDSAFLLTLASVSITGLLTLVLRSTALMGVTFTIHMGLVLLLFVTAPYGKFVHFVYRYAAIAINRAEEMSATGGVEPGSGSTPQ